MRRAGVLAALAALALPAGAGAAVRIGGLNAVSYPQISFSVVTSQPASQRPSIRENGHRVAGLQEQSLAQQKSVVLAVDNSQSMAGRSLANATSAAMAFAQSKPASDRVAVVSIGYHALSLSRFSAASLDAVNALRGLGVDTRSGTALYDAIVMSSLELAATDSPGRILILLTDGKDVSSTATLAQAIAAAKAAGVAVYPIAITDASFDPAPLQQIARETGGSYHSESVTSTSNLAGIYASIAAELARTWRVQYATAARPGDKLQISAALPGLGASGAAISLPGVPAAATAGPALPKAVLSGPTGTVALAVLVAVVVFLAVALLLASNKALWVRERLEPHVAADRAQRVRKPERFEVAAGLFRATERAFGSFRQWATLQRLIERADVPIRTVEFFYIALGAALLLGFASAVAGSPPLVTLGLMGFGAFVPWLVIWFKARRRLKAFENQLPDLLITMAASLKAGHSFRHGIQNVVEEGQAPAADEFKRVLTDTSLGRPMDDALAGMSKRVGSKNLEFVITAVTIQRQVGGSLAGLFDMVAETVRQRQQFARKIRSLTAMGKMSAYVLIGLPFFIAAALTALNSAYMAPLYHTPAGHILIAIGLVMMAFGSLLLKKIVSFRG